MSTLYKQACVLSAYTHLKLLDNSLMLQMAGYTVTLRLEHLPTDLFD